MAEILVGIVRGWWTCRSLALTVPHHIREDLGFKKGDRFAVKTDVQGRIIYEKLSNGQGATTNVTPTRDSRATIGTVEQ